MAFTSKIESKGMFASSIFYAIVGVLLLAFLPLNDYAPHLGLLGLFSLGAAYGLFRKRFWSLWFVVILFFSGTAFASFMIYSILAKDLLLSTVMIVYLILTWIFTAYVAVKREVLKG